jgi:hypothetical protein
MRLSRLSDVVFFVVLAVGLASSAQADSMPSISVPDTGATLALLGVALAGLGVLRRKLR